MNVKFKREGNTLVVFIEGEIDHHTSKDARERIDSKYIIEPVKNMIIDLSRVSFMDSAGIGLLMGRKTKVSSVGGKLTIRKAGNGIMRVLRMSRIDSLIEIDT